MAVLAAVLFIFQKKKIKKTLAAKIAGIKEYGTDARGESVDGVMTPVDLEPNLELSELHLTSGCHDNDSKEKHNRVDENERLGVLDSQLVSDNQKGVLKKLCSQNDGYHVCKDSVGSLFKDSKISRCITGEPSSHTSNMNQCNDNLLSNTNAKPVINVNS